MGVQFVGRLCGNGDPNDEQQHNDHSVRYIHMECDGEFYTTSGTYSILSDVLPIPRTDNYTTVRNNCITACDTFIGV